MDILIDDVEQINFFSIIREIAEGRHYGHNQLPPVHRFSITEPFLMAQRLANLEILDRGLDITPTLDITLINTPSTKFVTLKNAIKRSPRLTEPASPLVRDVENDLGERIAIMPEELEEEF